MTQEQPSIWFRRIAGAAKLMVHTHGGVAVVERASARALLTQEDSRLEECTETAWNHFTVGLSRCDLSSRALIGNDPEVLLIFDHTMYDENSARQAWGDRHPLSVEADVMLAAVNA